MADEPQEVEGAAGIFRASLAFCQLIKNDQTITTILCLVERCRSKNWHCSSLITEKIPTKELLKHFGNGLNKGLFRIGQKRYYKMKIRLFER